MAAPTKSRTSIWSGVSQSAGATTNSSWFDLTVVFETQVDIKISNNSTGPTIAGQVQVQVANDYNTGAPTLVTNFGGALVGNTTNSDTTAQFSVTIPIGVEAFRLSGSGNTGQSVTLDADFSKVTAIA